MLPFELVNRFSYDFCPIAALSSHSIFFTFSRSNYVPCTVGDRSETNDRSNAWYFVDNVTTLAFAWYYTDNIKYAEYATTLVKTWFLDPKTAMHPTLEYAQNGHRQGLIDWKDSFFLLDAIVLLEKAGTLQHIEVKSLKVI
jgi:hypothetical protein